VYNFFLPKLYSGIAGQFAAGMLYGAGRRTYQNKACRPNKMGKKYQNSAYKKMIEEA
jgi:hypothetical protein